MPYGVVHALAGVTGACGGLIGFAFDGSMVMQEVLPQRMPSLNTTSCPLKTTTMKVNGSNTNVLTVAATGKKRFIPTIIPMIHRG